MTADKVTLSVPAPMLKALGKWALLALGAVLSTGTGSLLARRVEPPAALPAEDLGRTVSLALDSQRRTFAASIDSLRLEEASRDRAIAANQDSTNARLSRVERAVVVLVGAERREARPAALRPSAPASARLEDALFTSAIGADQ